MEAELPERTGAWGGEGVQLSITRSDFIQLGKQQGIRAEEASRAFTALVRSAAYLGLVMACSQPPCRGKYCRGAHQITVASLRQAPSNVLRDTVGAGSSRWRVLQVMIANL
jgi:hypothetical protein